MSDASSSTFNDSKNLSTGKSLCTICHNEVVKYKCPSCSTRSCSVECVKKHKIESNCSGELKLPEIKSKEEILYNDFRSVPLCFHCMLAMLMFHTLFYALKLI